MSDRLNRPGDFIIVNEYDKPCAKLVALVIGVAGATGMKRARYIGHKYQEMETFEGTKLEDFGVAIEFNREGTAYRIVNDPDRECCACYINDGKLRELQEKLPSEWLRVV